MQNPLFKRLLPWIAGILVFIFVSLAYFMPVLEGKHLQQDDITRFKGASKEIVDFREKTGEEPLWTNSMFGGMPAFQISTIYKSNLIRWVDRIFQLDLPHPANLLFLYALGFFILLMVLGVDVWLAVAGALGFAFSSYFFIIIQAGHNSKAHAIGYMAPVIAGILLTLKGKYLKGGILTALFLALEIGTNHLQITYYLSLIIMVIMIVELIYAIKEKMLLSFGKAVAVLIVAGLLAVGPNISNLWTTYEYSQYTIRGKSELTSDKANKTSGLDKDYATAWSYGIGETGTLLIPDFKGGSSQGNLPESSDLGKALQANSVPNARQILNGLPLYWGTQPFTSGPVYAGAIMIFLFFLGMIAVKGRTKWWLVAATVFSIVLAWGHNFNGFTNFMLDHFPAYNKFRAVSMALVMAEFCIPLLGILGLQKILSKDTDKTQAFKSLKLAFYITGGICLLFSLFPGMFFDFVSPEDAQIKNSVPDWFITALMGDREGLLRADAFRSLVFIILAGVTIWAALYNKVKRNLALSALVVLVLVDMWMVDRRYLNSDNFVRKTQIDTPYEPSQADEAILKDKSLDYRVLNLTVNTFNDANTAYFHKSVGGYHGAKLRRYQELIENQLNKNNISVLNMLNTKYIISKGGEKGEPMVQINSQALGNAWFVEEFKYVPNADSEMTALNHFEPAKTAIIDNKFSSTIGDFKPSKDSLAKIVLKDYQPNHLTYEANSARGGMAVFSEIYYDKGWNAYVNGKLTPHFRTDYVLRGMVVPAGNNTIEFKFEPVSFYTGEKIALVSSVLLILLLLGSIGNEVRLLFQKK